MKKQLYIIPLMFILLITSVIALEIEQLPASSDGVRRLGDLVIYNDGSNIYYDDFQQTVVSVVMNQTVCTLSQIFTEGVTEEDNPYDLWYFCANPKVMIHVDYETASIEEFTISSLSARTNPRIVAVTEDFYIIADKYTGENSVIGITINRTNLAYIWDSPYQSNQPLYGHHLTGYRRGQSLPVYFDDQSFFVMSSFWLGATRYGQPNYIVMSDAGAQVRTFSGPAVNMSDTVGYWGYNEYYERNRINLWESDDYIYINNGQTIASGRTPNNVLFDKNNGLYSTSTNTIQLPNGTQTSFTSYDVYEDYKLIVYDDLTTELYYGNSLLIPKGIFSPSSHWLENYAVIDDAVFFRNATGNYKLTGLPSPIDPADFTILGQYATVDTEEEFNDTTFEFDVAYLNTLTDEVTFNPNFTSIDTDAYTYPFITMEADEGVRTEFLQTDFMVRAFDITDDELYVAYDCFHDTKELEVIDWDNFDNYTDLGYSSACEGTKERYTVREDDLRSFYQTEQFEVSYEGSTYTPWNTNFVDYNTSLCIQNLYYDVESNQETSVTFVQEFVMGYNTGIDLEFQNMLGATIGYITIMRDKDVGYNDFINITVNGESYTSYDDMIYFNNVVGDPIVAVNVYMTGMSMSYIIYINGQFYREGSATLYTPLPIDRVVWTTQTPSGSFNNDQYLGIGSWILVKGKTKPLWNNGVQFRGYDDTGHKYYQFTCDYAGRTNENHELRVYLNDAPSNEYAQFIDRWVLYDSNYVNYVKQLEDEGLTIDEDRVTQKQSSAKAFWCKSVNVCDDGSRMVFALLITLFFTFGAGMLMYRKYENTFSARILPVGVYVALFTYFASIGFFHEWYVALNIIFILGALAVTFNPSQRFGGGGGA